MDRKQNKRKGKNVVQERQWQWNKMGWKDGGCAVGLVWKKSFKAERAHYSVGLHFRWSITLIDFRLITTETLKPLCKVTICCWRWGVQMCALLQNEKHPITEATMSITLYQSSLHKGAKMFHDSMILNDNIIGRTRSLRKRVLPPKTFQNRWNRSDVPRGGKHTFWAWMESRWKKFTALAQGPNSWLCWYDSLTRQHTCVPDSSRKHYESHHRRPSVSYLHVFKSTTRNILDRHGAVKNCRHCVKNFPNFCSFLIFRANLVSKQDPGRAM